MFLYQFNNQILTIAGFVVTIHVMRRQIRNSNRQRVTEEQRRLYIQCYSAIEEIVKDPYLIFETSYFDKIREYQGEMKLVASSRVVASYRRLLEFVYEHFSEYQKFCKDLEPEDIFAADGTLKPENEAHYPTEIELLNFEEEEKKYREKNAPSLSIIKKYVTDLLNNMRADIGSDRYKDEDTK